MTRPADGLVLVTYRIVRPDGSASRHASLWDVGARPFRIRFHQGTPITGERDDVQLHTRMR
ncbi:hypothetical protein [Jatrophihabitans fulvus]